MLEITTITDTGQLVLPPALAADLSSAHITKMLLYSDGDSIVLKPLAKPDPGAYKQFMQEARRYAAMNAMKTDDIADAVARVRADANR